MIRTLFVSLLFLAIFSKAFAQKNTPSTANLGTIPLYEYNLIKLDEKASYLFNYRHMPNWNGKLWDQTSIRARWRALSWLKLGAGYVWQKGARHNIDWISDNGWKWKDTTGRVEKLAQVELIPRAIVGAAIWEWRQTLSYNDFIKGSKLISRLGANFYNLSIGNKSINAIFQIEQHFPFTEKEAVETWFYVLPLFEVSKHLKLGPEFGYARFRWSSTSSFERSQGASFDNNEEFSFVGLRLINVF